jgi:hypothetical protein
MDKTAERLKGSIEKQDSIDKALENLGLAVKQSMENHKTWLDNELRRSHQVIMQLTQERDLAVEQLLKAKKIIIRIKEDIQA